MTDAALPITEEAVKTFVDAYLRSFGAEIKKDGRRWTVSLPEDAETDFELDGRSLVVTTDPDDVADDDIALAPESAFVEQLLEEAAERSPTGSLALTGDDFEFQHPPWLQGSSVEILEQSFTPYYDRRALCALFHVGIETVSEYQSDELRAVAVDLTDHEPRPRLADTYLDVAEDTNTSFATGETFDQNTVRECLETARTVAEEEIQPIVDEIRTRATRATEVELQEYREYANQRLEELNSDIERLIGRIEETTERIDTAPDQSERVTALRERKELRAEREELREERDELQTAIEAGFPERRHEVRDRHSLTVRIRPVTLTSVTYERGDLELTLRDGETTLERSFAAAVGVGIIDDHYCDRCDSLLGEENPIALDGGRIVGENCC